MKRTLKAIYIGVNIALRYIIEAFVIKCLWNWIVVKMIDTHEIGMTIAIGIAVIISYIQTKYTSVIPDKEGVELANSILIFTIVKGILFLGIGYAASLLL